MPSQQDSPPRNPDISHHPDTSHDPAATPHPDATPHASPHPDASRHPDISHHPDTSHDPAATPHPDATPHASPHPDASLSSNQTGPVADLQDIIAEQEKIFVERQPESARMAARARDILAGGVTSSWQITVPQPVWLSHGKGSKIYDVDGNEYVDLHGGYGAALAGHAHPAIVEAVRSQVGLGTHFAQPTRNAVAVGEELARRFGLPLWRFANSGTEATMDAVHLMRADHRP